MVARIADVNTGFSISISIELIIVMISENTNGTGSVPRFIARNNEINVKYVTLDTILNI
jgi:hypothetical protein